MNTTTKAATTKAALKVCRQYADNYASTPAEDAAWRQARKDLLAAGICPDCATDREPTTSHLGPWQPGNYWEHAGRECPNCEEFFPCGEQPEFESAATEYRGDADPGL